MQQKPFGSDFDFYDGEWIFPTGALSIALLFGDFLWVKQILIIIFLIACLHTVHEHKIAFGKHDMGKRYIYAIVGFLSAILHFILPLIYVLVSYAMFASQLKADGEEELLVRKRKTFVTMTCILVFACGVHAWQGFLSMNDLTVAIANQDTQGMDGTISQ